MADTLPSIGGEAMISVSIVYFYCFEQKIFVLANIEGEIAPPCPLKCLPLDLQGLFTKHISLEVMTSSNVYIVNKKTRLLVATILMTSKTVYFSFRSLVFLNPFRTYGEHVSNLLNN